jgi:ribonuclease III
VVVEGYKAKGLASEFTLSGPGLARAVGGAAALRGQARPPRETPVDMTVRLRLPKPGLHNALNAAAAVTAYLAASGDPRLAAPILAGLKGVRRRQQVILDRDGITLVDDFAHHPAAVASTLSALRAGYPGRRILAAFEPRSNTSRRAVFQTAYVRSLRLANVVFLAAVDRPEKAPEGDRLDVARLALEVGQCAVRPDPASMAEAVLSEVRSGDMVVLMSNGDFGGLAGTLRRELEALLDEGRFSDNWLCSCRRCAQAPSLGLQPRTDLPPGEAAGYKFRDPSLLEAALTHRSVLGSKPQAKDGQAPGPQDQGQGLAEGETDNQRLEFLGDSVLNLIIAEILFKSGDRSSEGDMTRLRSCLVCESRLAEVARGVDLGFRLNMASGEECSGGRDRPSVLADAMEAVLGAVYLDGGHAKAMETVERLWGAYLDGSFPKMVDHKSRLQERTQSLKLGQPTYRLVGTSGPSHNQTFTMSVTIGDLSASATGTTKKMAGQRAARELYRLLVKERPEAAG